MLPASLSKVEASAVFEDILSLVFELRDQSVGQKEEIVRYPSPLVIFHLTVKREHVQVKGFVLGISTSR